MSSKSNVKNAKEIDIYTCNQDLTTNFRHLMKNFDDVQSPQFYAENNPLVKWSFAFIITGKIGDHSYDSTLSLYATTENMDESKEGDIYGGEVVFSLTSKSKKTHFKQIFVYNENEFDWTENGTGTGRTPDESSLVMFNNSRFSFEGDLNVKCEIKFFHLRDLISLFFSYIGGNTATFEDSCNLSKCFEKFYLSEDHSDVTICVKSKDTKSKEYPAHKIILSAVSKVFEAMFKHDTVENKLNCVVVQDIKEEVFLETLRCIYTGRVQNLDTLVYELLPVADRYDIEKLKIICGKALYEKLSVETVLEIVMLADTYNIDDLKIKAIRFIKNDPDFFKSMDSKAWDYLLSRPQLVKDLLIASNN